MGKEKQIAAGGGNAAPEKAKTAAKTVKTATETEAEDLFFMRKAISLAKKSAEEGEVPVGALVVWDGGEIVGRGRNRRETRKCALCHAEIEAIEKACKKLGGWRLHRATLYVTMEPCPMCAGAILNARIPRLVYGARDPKAGAYGSVYDQNSFPLNHRTAVTAGVLEKDCSALLDDFFTALRKSKKETKPRD